MGGVMFELLNQSKMERVNFNTKSFLDMLAYIPENMIVQDLMCEIERYYISPQEISEIAERMKLTQMNKIDF